MPHSRPFRFGLQCLTAESARAFAEGARQAEDLGYSTLFIPDHFVDHPLAPVPAMAAAAAHTTTLRVGALVLGNDYQHPVTLARELATVDLLSDGRLEIGIGAGWMTVDYDKAGIPLDRPGVRIDRLAESITVIKGLMADGPFSFQGQHYQVAELDGTPTPVQRPHPPFVIGGGGRRMLGLAAREADIVGINANLRSGEGGADAALSLSGERTDEKVGWVREAAGDRYDQLELQTLTGFVHFTDDRRSMAASVAPAFGTTEDRAFESTALLMGTVDQMIDDIRSWRDRWDISYVVVPQEVAAEFAPVVAALVGT
jgi:probable F420-dependent oxidoreductase